MMKLFVFDNYEGDKGVIVSENYDNALAAYRQIYSRNVVDNHTDYVNGGCYLTDLGDIKEDGVYVCSEY